MKTNSISFAAAAKHYWDHFWNSKSQSCFVCKGDLQAVEKVTNEDKLDRTWGQKVTTWATFHFLPSLDFWHVQGLQSSEKPSCTTGPESQNALHRTSTLHWQIFQDPCPGEQQKNWASHCQFESNLVSSAVQFQPGQTINTVPVPIFTVLVVLFLRFFLYWQNSINPAEVRLNPSLP